MLSGTPPTKCPLPKKGVPCQKTGNAWNRSAAAAAYSLASDSTCFTDLVDSICFWANWVAARARSR